MKKHTVVYEGQPDVIFLGEINTTTNPDGKLQILHVAFELIVPIDATSDVTFSGMDIGSNVKLSVDAIEFNDWQLIYKNDHEFRFYQKRLVNI